ncbi:conserved Plasmodium protein, unknown function [Plasmodium sp. gorilla clade G2]|uniref:conserved Plasmodium protein, unknown function n=1 Tax=Plasmodium sp. gorilla clade G2 TaxID=880535 RepID=UPI000D22BC83|nr:conserved Plasmodium protein, unknown function [Plasmodium sp. gorilla clade G2]SOV18423.1 conserved Plasmodium protein, unknown function [Plasmodium sp. gorilla clade G2]
MNRLLFIKKYVIFYFVFVFFFVFYHIFYNDKQKLKVLFDRICHKIFSSEYIRNVNKKKNGIVEGCIFNENEIEKKKNSSTFDCINQKLLKKSKMLFYIWSNNLKKIRVNEIMEKEKIFIDLDEEHNYLKKENIHVLNYIDLSTFHTYCSFYKLSVQDLLYDDNKINYYSKRYFIKTDHLNSDPLNENATIFIWGNKYKNLQNSKNYIYKKFHNILYYYITILMNNILNHTFYFVFNMNKENNYENFIIYQNKYIYPFKNIQINYHKDKYINNSISLKNTNIHNNKETISDFYIVEICHSLNGITFKQNYNILKKKLNNLYFNIEFVTYIFQFPPVFYHIIFIILFSLLITYIFYKIFIKYKMYI